MSNNKHANATGPIGVVNNNNTVRTSVYSGYYIAGATGVVINWEPSTEHSIKELLFSRHKEGDAGIRAYILSYIKQYKTHTNLRAAIQDVCPEFIDTLEKLVILL